MAKPVKGNRLYREDCSLKIRVSLRTPPFYCLKQVALKTGLLSFSNY